MLGSKNNHRKKRKRTSSKKRTEKRYNKRQKIGKFPVTGGLCNNYRSPNDDNSAHRDKTDSDYSVNLPPEIWDIIIGYLDTDSMEKYSMLSKKTLQHASNLAEPIYRDLFFSKFPRFCSSFISSDYDDTSCRLKYYLPMINLELDGNTYYSSSTSHSGPICQTCRNHFFWEAHDRDRLVDINFIKKFRKRVKMWLNTYRFFKSNGYKEAYNRFTLEYAKEHSILDIYRYCGIVKNYEFICEKENI